MNEKDKKEFARLLAIVQTEKTSEELKNFIKPFIKKELSRALAIGFFIGMGSTLGLIGFMSLLSAFF